MEHSSTAYSPATEREGLICAPTDFKSAFKNVAVFLGRPGSEVILFSDVPFNEVLPSIEEVRRLADRIGLEVLDYGKANRVDTNSDLPAIILLRDGRALSLLERLSDGRYLTSARELATGAGVELRGVAPENVRAIVTFGVVREDTVESAITGDIQLIVRKHWLVSTLLPFWKSYLQVALAALFINILALVMPLFTMNVYDRILPNEAMATLWVLVLGVAGAILFDLLLKSVRAVLIDHAGRSADLRLSYLLFEKVLHTTLASRPASTGDYANRITQYEFVREFFTSNTISVVIDTAFAFIFLIVIYVLSGWIVIVPVVAFLITIGIGLTAQRAIAKRMAAAQNEASQKQSLLVETISTIETVKSLGAEKHLLRRWHGLAKRASQTSEEIKQISANAANATGFVSQFVSIVIILAGAYQFAEGNMTTGAIIAAVMLSGRAVAPLGQIAMTLARFRQAVLSLQILNSIMSQPEDRPDSTGFVNREIYAGDFSFQLVDFAYPGTDYKVLNGFNLTVKAGERVGIIGKIGSGKTTVGRLLGGLYAPGAGSLLIDGVDVRQYHPAVVRSAVSVASQSADLFSGTIKENLLMGRPDASDEDIIAVSRVTGVEDFVSRHPRGYDMPVGERGSNLSGGQRQAVAIARLLMSKPKIVFLDEPSGAMDMASERLLINKLQAALAPEMTVIISTHRHSMLELIDRLIVMDQGRVIADGPKAAIIEHLQKRAVR
ncbi:type I secretion system permease/ATPase [Flaviflagellibacter deserti]|uniref:Type I secretion system permease/ATPase n=1 Tax=Flaviflagellibacter deserti TaxID=2267266 RepID=A0ABV9Z6E7_9HYPH